MTTFWQTHQVGGPYPDLVASTVALNERSFMYPTLDELMPVSYPGKTVLDFGCGPGHDTIRLLEAGAKHVYFADVSWQALQTTNDRLVLHGLRDRATALFADDQLPVVEHVNCAGVLHHMHDPSAALLRIRHALRTNGEMRVMVYDGDQSVHSQSDVPITEWWTHKQFLELAADEGWRGEYVGSYECSADWRPDCFAACYKLT